jgi:protein-S-isoprenylcysteine O-methyltransferase Ste14
MNTDTTEDDRAHRWATAEALARGDGSPDVTAGIHRRRTRTWLLIATFIATLIALTAAAGFLFARHQPDEPAPATDPSDPLWAEITGLTLAVVGLLLIGFGIWQMVRAGSFGNRWHAPASVLTWAERRELRREVLGRRPLDPAHLLVARDLAQRMTRTNGMLAMYSGFLLGQVGQNLSSPHPWRLALLAVVTLLFSIAGLLTRRDVGRARAFLDQHLLSN